MRILVAAGLLIAATPAAAEVASADANGFEVTHSVSLVMPLVQSYAAFGRIAAWWSDEHTYSGKAANLRLSLQPGGCFCETIPEGGGVEHLRVALVQPGERIVMTGGLGPLLYEAAAGVMDVRFERIAGGSKISMSYRAAGFAKGGADKLAPVVDKVLGEQLRRFRAYAARGGRK